MERVYTRRRMRQLLTLPSLIAAMPVLGAGYQVFPTASSTARLLAGNGILGEEAGDMYFNAAGLALQPAGDTLQLGAAWLKLRTRFEDRESQRILHSETGSGAMPMGGNTEPAIDAATPLGSFFVHRPSDGRKPSWGLGLTTPFGLVVDYDPAWVGRYQAITSDLAVVDLNGAMAWQPAAKLSVGAGLSAQYADATLSQAVPTRTPQDLLVEIQGDSVGYGFNLGALYQATPGLRIGASYRSRVAHRLDGERSTLLNDVRLARTGARARLDIPEFALFSLHYASAKHRWSVAGGLRFTRWSRFDELRVDFADGTSSIAPEHWQNSWTGSASADYRLGGGAKLIASYSYDATPVPDAAARSARIPDTHRNIVGLGYQQQGFLCAACTLYLAYHCTLMDDRTIDREELSAPALTTRLRGRFKASATSVFAAHWLYRF